MSVVLSRLFEARQLVLGRSLPASLADLAPGYTDSGVER